MTRYEVLSQDKKRLALALAILVDHEGEDSQYFEEWLNEEWDAFDENYILEKNLEENKRLKTENENLKNEVEVLENRIKELLGKDDEE